jgi:hypothetical protein
MMPPTITATVAATRYMAIRLPSSPPVTPPTPPFRRLFSRSAAHACRCRRHSAVYFQLLRIFSSMNIFAAFDAFIDFIFFAATFSFSFAFAT